MSRQQRAKTRQPNGSARAFMVAAGFVVVAVVAVGAYFFLNRSNGAPGGDFNGVPVYSSLSHIDAPNSTAQTLVTQLHMDTLIDHPQIALYSVNGSINNVLSFYQNQLVKDNWATLNGTNIVAGSDATSTTNVFVKGDQAAAYGTTSPVTAADIAADGLTGKVDAGQSVFVLITGTAARPTDQNNSTGR